MAVRWGFVGAGNVTEAKAAPGAAFTQEGSQVVAVARTDLARAEAYAQANGIARAHATVEALCADPEVDAVFVCTPHHLHAAHALAAIAAGKHVLCEKPLTITTEDGAKIVAAAKRAGVVLAVAYYRRFYPVLERLHAIVQSGRLGTLTSAQMVCRSYSIPPRPPAGADRPAGWRTRLEQAGGGALTDVGSHPYSCDLGHRLARSELAAFPQADDQASAHDHIHATRSSADHQNGQLNERTHQSDCPITKSEIDGHACRQPRPTMLVRSRSGLLPSAAAGRIEGMQR